MMGKRIKKIISLPLHPELLAKLDDYCDLLGIDRTSYITNLIEQSLEKKNQLNPVISESEYYKFISGGKFSSAEEIKKHNEDVFKHIEEENEKLSKEIAKSMADKLEQIRKAIRERRVTNRKLHESD